MMRYPLGGNLSCFLQYLVGFKQLGHDVHFVEKAHYTNACYDPWNKTVGDDASTGMAIVSELLARFGLGDKWCFVDLAGTYYGYSKERVEEVFRTADLFVDYGAHGSWLEEAQHSRRKILIEGEPGYTQMQMLNSAKAPSVQEYDSYYSIGRNIGTSRSSAPSAGIAWLPTFHPVVLDLFKTDLTGVGGPWTTVMNWQSHAPLAFDGRTFGQKDIEFPKFLSLPRLVNQQLEIAVSGSAPREELQAAGWGIREAQAVTRTFDSFRDYLWSSAGEFSVAKNVFVETQCGWFSDRSAAYLASGRPIVVQDTGIKGHLPTGRGVMSVRNLEEAAEAMNQMGENYAVQSAAALEIARQYLDHRIVLNDLIGQSKTSLSEAS
jgi:hypothetical protein